MIPTGVCPVVAVPFREDGRVDLAGFDVVVDHLVATGVDMLSLFGLASEFHKLADPGAAGASDAVAGPSAWFQGRGHALRHRPCHRGRRRPRAVLQAGRGRCADHPSPASPAAVRRCGDGTPHGGARERRPAGRHPVRPGCDRRADRAGYVGRTAPAVPPLLRRQGREPPCGSLHHRPHRGHRGGLRALVGYAGLHLPDGLRRGASGLQPGARSSRCTWSCGAVGAPGTWTPSRSSIDGCCRTSATGCRASSGACRSRRRSCTAGGSSDRTAAGVRDTSSTAVTMRRSIVS